jgi:CBS domain-containing protein
MEHEGKAIIPVFTVTPQTNLITALEKMTSTKTHRVWVTKGEELVGVVSLSDVMPLLVK